MIKITPLENKSSIVRMYWVNVEIIEEGVTKRKYNIVVSDEDEFLVGQVKTLFYDYDFNEIVSKIRKIYPVGYIRKIIENQNNELSENSEIDMKICSTYKREFGKNKVFILESQEEMDREVESLRCKVKQKEHDDKYGMPISIFDFIKTIR